MKNGNQIACSQCDGHGIIVSGNPYDPSPEECTDCSGSGHLWKYAGGAISKFYGGPFIGRDACDLKQKEAA